MVQLFSSVVGTKRSQVKKSEHFYIEFCQNIVLQQIPVFSQLLDENKTRCSQQLCWLASETASDHKNILHQALIRTRMVIPVHLEHVSRLIIILSKNHVHQLLHLVLLVLTANC